MKEIVEISTVNDYCAAFNKSTLHPLVSVIDLSTGSWGAVPKKTIAVRYHFYGIFLKQGQQCTLKYGRENYDYQDGTLVFISPGQIVNISHIDYDIQPSGFALLFHPDLLKGTNLGQGIENMSFFSYQVHEALHLSEKERQIVLDCFDKIQFELSHGIDKHSKNLIVANIELFLRYCTRFYDRQFITRETVNQGVIKKFESALNSYIKTGKTKENGTPSVSYFAEQQHLSSNYFGDLVKREIGISAHEFIQTKIIEVAKEKMFDHTKSLSEIAYELGFKYPQHFTRLFKNKVGYSPSEFRKMN